MQSRPHYRKALKSIMLPVVGEIRSGEFVLASAIPGPYRQYFERAAKLDYEINGPLVVNTEEGTPMLSSSDKPTPTVLFRTDHYAAQNHPNFDPDADLLYVQADEAEVPQGVLEALLRAAEQFPDQAHFVPLSTRLLPVHAAHGAVTATLPGGVTFWQMNEMLNRKEPTYPEATWYPTSCVLTRDPATLGEPAIVVDDCYCYLPGKQDKSPAPGWGFTSAQYRRLAKEERSDKPAVHMFTSNIGPWGGVACLFRVTEQLAACGVNAQVSYMSTNQHQFTPGVSPIFLKNIYQAEQILPDVVGADSGILFATHWWGEQFLAPVWRNFPDFKKAAYWQDREDMFCKVNGDRTLTDEQAKKYAAIPNRVINAEWVATSGQRDLGIDDYAIIPVGIDTQIFRPKPRTKRGALRVLAMFRPSTPRRGSKALSVLYSQLRQKYGSEVSLELFGEKPKGILHDKYHGWVSEDRVAELMQEADVYIEPSIFQGFGLPGLEAMACGCAVVSTDNKGIHEYGVDGENCIITPHDELFTSTCMLIENEDIRATLSAQGIQDALLFDWKYLGLQWVQWVLQFDMMQEAYPDALALAQERWNAYYDHRT